MEENKNKPYFYAVSRTGINLLLIFNDTFQSLVKYRRSELFLGNNCRGSVKVRLWFTSVYYPFISPQGPSTSTNPLLSISNLLKIWSWELLLRKEKCWSFYDNIRCALHWKNHISFAHSLTSCLLSWCPSYICHLSQAETIEDGGQDTKCT
jgi:hypothetical protein